MKTLIVITGPTGVGKTALAIDLAQALHTEIVSADSRQIYRGMPICTAAPDEAQLAMVPHHFIATLDLKDYFSASLFETQALEVIEHLFERGDYAVMCGGSMMYVDAVCNGIDDIPTISDEIRTEVLKQYQTYGLESVQKRLLSLDSEYYAKVDLRNAKRIIHAVEICLQSGTTYTSLRQGRKQLRPFRIIKVGLRLPREQLFERINRRVDIMLGQGLEQEARSLYHLRHLNSLNTVGMKEMFAYFDGTMDFTTACERIKKNTRVYAKKQLTWYARDEHIHWIAPDYDELSALLDKCKA